MASKRDHTFNYITAGDQTFLTTDEQASSEPLDSNVNKNNILSQSQIANGLKKNQLSPEELQRLGEIDPTGNLSLADRELVAKYNNYVLYKNASLRSQWEAQVNVASSQGPIAGYQPSVPIQKERPIDYSELLDRYSQDGDVEIYDLFGGKTNGDNVSSQSFIFTDEGIVPLSEDAAKTIGRYTVKDGQPSEFLFNVEGDREEYGPVGGGRYAHMPVFVQYPGHQPELPKGAVVGIPEGEDRSNYVAIGTVENEQGSAGNGDQYVYVKVLDRPTEVYEESEPQGPPLAVYPSIPEEPDYLEMIELPEQEEVQPIEKQIVEEQVNPASLPSNDPIQKEEVKDNLVVQEDHIPKKVKDPLFGANLVANIAEGLKAWNLEGIKIGVPSYDQQRYASGELGPAVQNLFREGN